MSGRGEHDKWRQVINVREWVRKGKRGKPVMENEKVRK